MARDIVTSRAAPRRAGGARVRQARGGAVAALSGVLALGAVAIGGLVAAAPSGAVAPTPGWTAASTPAPTGPDTPGANPNATWASVSCVSAVFCAGAGKYTGTDSDLPLLGLEINGTWTTQEAPLPSNATGNTTARLTSVSCAAVGWCVAVGFYSDTTGGFSQHALVETLAGGSWSPLDAPVPPDGQSASPYDALLQTVDCTTVQACVAVGSYNGTGGQLGLIDTESAGTWTALVAPQPSAAAADQQVSVSDVACPALGPCAATGTYEAPSSPFPILEPFLLQQSSAGSWSAVGAPLPEGSNTGDNVSNKLSGVSCAAALCEAVGQVQMGTGQDVGLLEQLTNGSWTPTAAPLPPNTGTGGAGLNGVSCTFDGICTAVGSYNNAVNGGLPLIDTVDGATVTATEGPQPADTATGSGSAGTLQAVSCLSGTDCAAAGYYRNSTNSGMDAALTLTLSGGVWSAPTITPPAGAGTGASASSILSSVSCTARGPCETVGNYADTAGTGFGLVESYVPPEGYWSVASDGGVFNYGPNAPFLGSMGGQRLNAPMVGMAATPGGGGYWSVASDGGVFSFGNAAFYGSTGSMHLNAPIVGMAATPDGGGYWLVAADGGVFNYGDAPLYGSAGSLHLNKPIVGMAVTPDGHGYWLVASDGGIFSYGDALFYGSRGGQPLNEPIVGMAASASGLGYWLVASDGGIFSYGDATFLGSTGSMVLNKPIVGMMSAFDGAGYWLTASDGGIFNYGDTGFDGSAGSIHLNAPVVSNTAS
jgi:hypothetical protein